MKATTPRRRSRSNDGTPSRISRVIPIDPGLLGKLLASFYEPIVRRGARVFHGPNPAAGSPVSEISDEQVLTLRRMHEWHGMGQAAIARATGLSPHTVFNLIKYRNRVHLDPGPAPAEA